MSYYIHSVPGRLRVKSPLVKGNRKAAAEVEGLLVCIQGVDSVLVNVITGSIRVSYDRDAIGPDSIISVLQNSGYFEPSKAVTHDQYINRAVSKAGHMVGRSIAGAFLGQALEGTPLSLLSIFI